MSIYANILVTFQDGSDLLFEDKSQKLMVSQESKISLQSQGRNDFANEDFKYLVNILTTENTPNEILDEFQIFCDKILTNIIINNNMVKRVIINNSEGETLYDFTNTGHWTSDSRLDLIRGNTFKRQTIHFLVYKDDVNG